mmetsp:Transcript_27393/g.68597  ORF Transcript_27393/g.68597 Transcript_27393/m.68597 type:complete len:324 (+) Transcript_27393:1918-2889(+)
MAHVRDTGGERLGGEPGGGAAVERGEERVHVRQRSGLVKGEGHAVSGHLADVDAGDAARLHRGVGAGGTPDRHGVEERRRGLSEAQLGNSLGEDRGQAVRLVGDRLEALRPMIHRVHPRHVGQQRLRGANVGRRLVAANVLLARLHRHAQRGRAQGVDGDTDDAPGHQALVVLRRGQVPGVRAAEPHGDAEALRGADTDVSLPLAGRGEDSEGEQIRRRHHPGTGCVCGSYHGRVIDHCPVGGRILEQYTAHVVAGVVEGGLVAHKHLESQAVGARLAHADGLGVTLVGDEKLGLLTAVHCRAHGHGLSSGRALVQQRRVRHG